MDLLVLIDELDEALRMAKRFGFGADARVDRAEITDLLERMRAAVPAELNQSRWIAGEREEAVVEAKLEAERIIKDARAEQARQLAKSDLLREAEREAETTIETALTQEREIRLRAEAYVDATLNALEINLGKLTAAVARARERLGGKRADLSTAGDEQAQVGKPA